MGSAAASCGHELKEDDWLMAYWWKSWDREGWECLCYGSLCSKCIPIYRAVVAETYEEADTQLKGGGHGII